MNSAVDLSARLPEVQQPTLILHGDADRLAPLAGAEWLAQTLPRAELITLPGAGHVPIMTQPETVAGHISRFFGAGGGAA